MAKIRQQKPAGASEQQIAGLRDGVIKRMLDTPPEKHKDVPKKRKPKDTHGGA